ncbi:efflux RND transporter periplasmic adaptor subunit [Hymenobacter taeanensis]|uniref:Efflux RND transporter periplasmic adaptor subunit n=1 Tax=Hymenobacter taeanensis TaxID=2735321 RepID=A0A6M6BJE0_9BACT|nr:MULTISPECIES: efflux RND transporter periplasmic adaptor subunit [Hymenobacter]QJX48162.1 efflux RND transporter periplasmic adaptor subunit [Hymenobacter taeanensis]UOQ82363.1 efflux RND transporter periplasmic adaptor subunit [Hymenobacter sp. 5414T-23]
MNRILPLPYFLFFPFSLGLFSSCSPAEPTTFVPAEVPPGLSAAVLAQVNTDSVRLTPLRFDLHLEGRVVPNADRTTEVFPLVGGLIERVPVALGDRVVRGQVLAIIHSPHMPELAQQRTEAQVDLTTAQQRLAAATSLHHDGLASAQELTIARAALQRAQSELTRLQRQLEVYGPEDRRYILRAPQAGIITEKNATEGMQFAPEQVGSLFTLTDLSDVWVMAHVFQSDIEKVQTGLPVEIRTLSYPNQVFTGKVDRVFNLLNPDSKTLQVRVRLANPHHLLKPGMYARLRLQHTTAEQLPAVPSASLVFANGKRYALVLQENQQVETRSVAVQHASGGLSFLSSGLAPGERVINSNPLLLYKELND